MSRTSRLRRILLGRVSRNVLFWLFLLYVADGYNIGNDGKYGFGMVASPAYLPVMGAMLVLQCALMYTNNLLLIPRFLARRRLFLHIPAAAALCFLTGLATAVVMKLAAPWLRVEKLHHVGFTTTSVSRNWTAAALLDETLAFFLSDIFWVIAFTLAWYANDYVRQQRALRESEAQRLKTELAFLRNQLNPHFLFNTLNNIYGLVYMKSDDAPELILKLSALLRYLLYETDVETISFSKERAAIEAYSEIELLRLSETAQLRLDLAADGDYQIPPLLWLPVLENSFKHGARLVQEQVAIDFSLRISQDRLRIRASNRFEPLAGPAAQRHGLGLGNLAKRLQILYPGSHEISVCREDGVYSILVDINLKAYAAARADH